jgi:predicted RecB family nuclease
MRLIASDFIAYYRPSPCDLRVFLRQKGEAEAEASPFDEVLRRLGIRHEKEHLGTLGAFVDLSPAPLHTRIENTLKAIRDKTPVVYQPAFIVRHVIAGTDVEIVGAPDFLILDGEGYFIRDSKMSRRIDSENHPEIILQIQLYGWLFERSCGSSAKALQVHSGTNEIVNVRYDGGASALDELERLLTIKQLKDEPYEPVGWSKCGGCGFRDRCWQKAEANADGALVPDIDQSLARTFHGIGLRSRKEMLAKFDVNSLSEFKRPYGKREQKVGKKAERIIQFAQAMEKHREKVLAIPAIPVFPNYVMFDLEGMPPHLDELDKIYLWGTEVFGEKPSGFMPAVSGFGPNGDREGWLKFLENARRIFDTHGDIPFVHWAPYEKTYLTRYIDRHGDVDGIANRVKLNLLDLLTVARDCIVLPIPSFSLKVVEKYIGFNRSQAESGGQWAMATFIEATESSDEAKRQQLMDEILKYNEEDLGATWAVFEWLRAKAPAAPLAGT